MQDAFANIRSQEEAVDLQIWEMKARSDRLTDVFVDGGLPKEAYLERRERLQLELAGLEEAKCNVAASWVEQRAKADKILELLKGLNYAFKSSLPLEKRKLLEELTSNRMVSGKNVEATLFPPFHALAKTPSVYGGAPQRDKPRTLVEWIKAEWTRRMSETTETSPNSTESTGQQSSC
jgi:hypothetical protein